MARIPLADETALEGFAKEMHDGAGEDEWATQHVARVFAAHPEFLEQYLTFYYPWHSNAEAAEDAARLTPRTKELVRLRIAILNGCVTCQSARLAPESVPEEPTTVRPSVRRSNSPNRWRSTTTTSATPRSKRCTSTSTTPRASS